MSKDLTIEELKEKLLHERLDNSDPKEGFALLAVLKPSEFADYHLPGALCVAPYELAVCLERFERDKHLIICSWDSASAREVAKQLEQMGFTEVSPLMGGVESWTKAGIEQLRQRQGLPEEPEPSVSIDSEDRMNEED